MESFLYISCIARYTPLTERKLSIRGVNALNNRLEEIRKQRGIKQEELAAALEVSRQTIGSLENGRYNPSILLAFKIARFFDMSIEEIFIYEEDDHV
jgi:putative transcriptional regulator